MIDQVQKQCPEETDRELLARKIYRHRVSMVGNWDSINKERYSSMPYNLIPQRSAKVNQVLNNRINDPWNQPTTFKVIIVNEEHKPASSTLVLDSFDRNVVTSRKIDLEYKIKHPENKFNWQFGIDRLLTQNFVQSWLNLQRLVTSKSRILKFKTNVNYYSYNL